MPDTFAALKKNRQSDLDRINAELTKLSSKGERAEDDRFWQPTVDKAGNGYAIIRFLPAPKGEDVPWVRIFNHGFKGPSGKWYIENSLTTIGQKDPVSEYNSELWNSTTDDNSPARKQVRDQKRKLTYISNILVVKDSENPENEGKVKLFRYGKKIFDKINALMNPEFEDEARVNPFDFWEGANFKLKVRKVEGYRNYDKSEFDAPSKISDKDADIEKIWNTQHSLQAFVAPDQFKSYDELKKRLNEVLGMGPQAAARRNAKADDVEDDTPPFEPTPRILNVGKTAPAPKAKTVDDDDGDMEYLRKLAADDE
jgi:hypothetical protein